jgi:hypothetical protein
MAAFPVPRKEELNGLARRALGVGIVAGLGCALGAWFSPAHFFRAYLVAYLFFLSIAHGCFAVLMVYHLTGGAWGFLIRNILEAGMRTLPLLAALFVPLALGVSYLYLWADAEAVSASAELRHKEIYLNVPFFIVRAAVYFAAWLAVAYFLSRWSGAQERTGDPAFARNLTRLSGPGLVIYGITIFFASIDWIMSLQPDYRSTIIAPLFASGEVLVGFACSLIVMAWLVARPPVAVAAEAVGDLGSLLFTFLIIWAYMAFFQFMLIWIANLPYDSAWYVARTSPGWLGTAWALFLLHFAVPFFLLLLRDIKRQPRALAALAALLLLMHLVYLYYEVLPAFPSDSLANHWVDFLALLGIGGFWLAYFVWDLGRHALLPGHDANQEAALRLAPCSPSILEGGGTASGGAERPLGEAGHG